ncbi:hypothetical protein HOLleu_40830 [Holothuria leucospilota]|uniref:Ig-like domain-containing protein n=1 Tax=Holothuria leucospilota TaxID=206669 RepID=A0A9Q0YE10_HOLLE|nr:hypothetical protein HOLleu_40830 [Holothuria leucospilota]
MTNIPYILMVTLDFSRAQVCDSPQYLELEKTGIINCSFEDGFSFVLWYNSTNEEKEQPILNYINSVKSGVGFTSGEFDVKSDGSLVINNVGIQHERYFTTVYAHPNITEVTTTVVFVFVTVKPSVPYPRIGEYRGNVSNLGFLKIDTPSLICSAENVRPEIPLMWMIRTNDGDKNISYTKNTTQSEILYTTRATTDNVFVYSSSLSLMVCKSIGLPGMLQEEESLVLVQNGSLDFENKNLVVKHSEIGSRLELICSDKEIGFLVWRRVSSSKKLDELLLYAVFLTKNITRIIMDKYEMDSWGILVLPVLDVHHGGLYRCISSNGIEDNVLAYEVLVYANPVPPHTVVEGCQHSLYCNLKADDEGYLTCTVKGIRPKAQLEFKTFNESDSSLITFINQQMFAKDNGETFDLTLTTEYRVNDKSSEQLSIECKVSGLHEDVFNITRVKVNLHFKREEARVESCSRTLLILILSTNIIILLIFTYYFARKLFKRTSYRYDFFTPRGDNRHGTVALVPKRQETTL